MSLEKSRSIEAGLQSISTSEPKKPKKIPLCTSIKLILTNITVEPIMVCYILPSVMASIATQNLSLEKACRVNLNLPVQVCDAITARNTTAYPEFKRHEEMVQSLATNMAIWKSVIQSVIPSFILLFLGAWSDRHKRRKPCIMSPIVGEMLSCLGYLLCTYFFYELPMQVNVFVEAVFPAMTGGWFAMFMGVFSFVSGVSSVETRTLRIGAVNMFANVSICMGIALSGILYKEIGFYGVYSLALVMYLSGFLYGLFYVKDIPKELIGDADDKVKVPMKKAGFLCDFFNWKAVKDTFDVALKKRDGNRRSRVFIIMILVILIIGPLHGEMNVVYYFVRYKFDWDSIDYSIFSTVQFIAHMLGTLFSLALFTNYLKLDDAILGMISSTSKILAAVVYAYAPTGNIFYLGAIVEFLNGTSFIAMRSIISKLVPADELGKINSLFGVCEALAPLVYGPLYSITYTMTIDIFPGAFYIIGGAFTIPAVFIFFWFYLQHKKDAAYLKTHKKQTEKLLSIPSVVDEILETQTDNA